jgi:arylsulfatase A-like enzyme
MDHSIESTDRMDPRPRAALVLFVAILGTGCKREAAPRGRFVLVSLDTLRADHLGSYGYARPTSPFLDSLAARGTLFENAIAQLPGTLPSHMSIFTGLYPAEHGVYPPDAVLSPRIRTLPEVLHAHGFRTAGHVEGGYVEGRYGFSRGFDEWSDPSPLVEREGRLFKTTDAVKRTFRSGLDFLGKVRPSESFFLFLHTYSVHDPYDPPEPYRSLYWKGEPPPGAFEPIGTELLAFNQGGRTLAPRAVEYYQALYDAQINYTDDVVKDFFGGMASLGLGDDVTVIVTSDHGEEFLEHGKLVHQQVYHEDVHVPLIVVPPGQKEARRVSSLVQSIDIAPTVYELARVPLAARPHVSGRSLVPLLSGEPRPAEDGRREAYAEAFVTRDRVLYRQSGDGFHALVRRQPPAGEVEGWARGPLRFETFEPRVRFWIASYWKPRELLVRLEGGRARTEPIDTAGRWMELDVPSGEGKRGVEIASPTCTVPRAVGQGEDVRCLSFRVKDLEPSTWELFDVGGDARESRDLSQDRPALTRELAARLGGYRWKALAAPTNEPLDREAEEQLRALGYLQ